MLALCELMHPKLHGNVNSNFEYGKYLITFTFQADEFFNDSYIEILDFAKQQYNNQYNYYYNHQNYENKFLTQHPFVRNYWEILKHQNIETINLDIISMEQNADGHFYAVKKTFYLKMFQRKWKKIYKQRRQIIKYRSNPRNLIYLRIHGKWPKHCAYFPGLYNYR